MGSKQLVPDVVHAGRREDGLVRKQGKGSTLMLVLTFLVYATEAVAVESPYDPLAVTEDAASGFLMGIHNT